ncbi:MAG: methylated-DNA--[protein]-cysteine S-methyltransferase [Bacteroidia bacterium]
MEDQATLNYSRISDAIRFILNNFREQPALEEISRHVHLSPAHFQRLFTEWAGTSPKKFLHYISLQHAKSMLENNRHIRLFDAALETGLSGTSRLHDLFISLEGMTPAEYKHGGKNLHIQFSFADSPFGPVMVASTQKGLCHMVFTEDESSATSGLKSRFPNATFQLQPAAIHQKALSIFSGDWSDRDQLKLHLRGSEFQLKVWETLLSIPMGRLSSYGEIAEKIGDPKASRAVGTAIGSNPVAFLIPCHRVIQASGALGGYMWGKTRKAAIIGWEAAKSNPEF